MRAERVPRSEVATQCPLHRINSGIYKHYVRKIAVYRGQISYDILRMPYGVVLERGYAASYFGVSQLWQFALVLRHKW